MKANKQTTDSRKHAPARINTAASGCKKRDGNELRPLKKYTGKLR